MGTENTKPRTSMVMVLRLERGYGKKNNSIIVYVYQSQDIYYIF